ncbi:formylglycine-generating enzyme required for sulfatase activity [Nitrosomonas oligotropha]|uniref:Formylglycine-generating enzyme required for sulfatase activity n=1 Tax=Nitrosomonas oligotropha TaxID=42354 RepID=A0A2T5I3I7_9PROT|nr:formylglycine-generating enzyme family protein [Nitrosomonas oligotropha]PTQ78407.1 formylglycine-generating enzyme required for sulfatase activity [Nitrosomonas oligotropha]
MTIYIRQHTIFPEEFPESWASDWGEDEFGLWMALTYKGVRQAFRWCEPGTFLMGSPEDEPERDDDELQHQVTLTKGFWIANAAVTQGLWQIIMRNNPSTFIGDENPVENISWEDAQAFIAKMNGMKAELKLCLPTESQWEYACRAGTTTPFSWGEQIHSSLVNFEGRRERTVAVKELPCNDWGLYQMHGNVWEWCQDWYGHYPTEPVIDPQGPESGGRRVLRGGSWISDGRYCRSADRYRSDPSYRDDAIGFRLARGQ